MTADMHCDEFVELVTAFLEGTLTDDDRGRLVAHLSLCDGCSRYLDQFRTAIALLGDLPADPAAPELRDALASAFRNRAGKHPGSA
jgi:anti-sigma factor RsiW